jgi:hypothetical protein
MALNLTTFYTVIGKNVKQINEMVTYYTELETAKDATYAVMNTAGLQDLYAPLPNAYLGFYGSVAGWIQELVSHTQSIIVDEEFVLDELPIFASDTATVLDAIFDYMVLNSSTLKASVVTLAGADADISRVTFQTGVGSLPAGSVGPSVLVSRLLDGVNAPTNLVRANTHYNNLESQLAMTSTVFAKCVASAPGQEVLQLFSDSPEQASYTYDAEAPGNGGQIVNAESNNLIATNYDFTAWSGDNATGWPATGGSAGTAWEDSSGTGVGPMRINTAGTYVKQQMSGLQRNTAYMFAAAIYQYGASGTATAKMRIENVDGVTVHKAFTNVTSADVSSGSDSWKIMYGFYSPNNTVNLDDIYLAIEHDAESDSGTYMLIYKVVCVPVVYFNGLGFAFWNPYVDYQSVFNQAVGTTHEEIALNGYAQIAIVNGNEGVLQTFFRKAFNVQMPTDGTGSHTIADTLAT